MYILGINSAFHEPSACLVKDGIVIAAAEEERFTGIKHGKDANPFSSWILPFQAISWCLAKEGITINQIDNIAYSFKPSIRLVKKFPTILKWLANGKIAKIEKEFALFYFNSRIPLFLKQYSPKKQEIRKRFITTNYRKLQFHKVEHHLAHAASAFLCSPFKEAAILSVDGIGEITATLLAYGKGNSIKKIREFGYPDSLGFFYEEITEFLGFQRNHDEYKIMGLSAYGKPKYYNQLRELILLKPDGRYEVKINFEKASLFGCRELKEILGPPRLWSTNITQRHKDIAASAQKILEDAILHILDWLYERTRSRNLCLAGGVALNCLMNQRIKEKSKFRNMFVQPASHDAGTALGAALYVYNCFLENERTYVMDHPYLGPEFTSDEIKSRLEESKVKYKISRNIAKECAKLISDGNIIGWFQGAVEWGPRALGNRSILADPRNCKMKDIINKIKNREDFRPLAPVILEEKLSQYFEEKTPSPFMLFTYHVKSSKKKKIPAVVHFDGTARTQTVNKEQNKLLYVLTEEFEKITGIPILINTSLNYARKPIVCTIEQSLDCFYNSGLDYLAMGNFLISKVNKE